jgi:hypothetical protein
MVSSWSKHQSSSSKVSRDIRKKFSSEIRHIKIKKSTLHFLENTLFESNHATSFVFAVQNTVNFLIAKRILVIVARQ